MYEKERERRFHYELTKCQSDFEFLFALIIGALALMFVLLSYHRGSPFDTLCVCVAIVVLMCLLLFVYILREKRFKKIKEKYIDSYWD